MEYVRIDANHQIVERIPHDPKGRYHPAILWLPFTTIEEKEVPLAAARGRRHMAETGGVIVSDVLIRTDPVSQAKISGAVQYTENDPDAQVIEFEALPGVWIDLDAVAMRAIGVAVGRHVQACFRR